MREHEIQRERYDREKERQRERERERESQRRKGKLGWKKLEGLSIKKTQRGNRLQEKTIKTQEKTANIGRPC